MRTLLLGALVACQALLVLVLLRTASTATVGAVSALEAPVPVSLDDTPLERGDVVDTVHVLSGAPENGSEGEGDKLRESLIYDRGHFSWLVLDEPPSPGNGLHRRVAPFLPAESRAAFEAAVDDGILSFFYDLGGRDEALDVNWNTVGQVELQSSPLLAWAKRVDFMVISRYDAEHCGGLRRMLEGDPSVPLLGPPLALPQGQNAGTPTELAITVTTLMKQRRLLALPRGLFRLSPRLQAYTYVASHRPGSWDAYATALAIRGKRGWSLCAGSDALPPDDLIRRVESELGQPVVTYVGATGYRGASEEPAVVAALERLHRTHPDLDIVPTHATSFTTHALISRIFGPDHYRAGILGARIGL